MDNNVINLMDVLEDLEANFELTEAESDSVATVTKGLSNLPDDEGNTFVNAISNVILMLAKALSTSEPVQKAAKEEDSEKWPSMGNMLTLNYLQAGL